MRLTHVSTKLFLLLSIVFAVAFAGDDNPLFFGISTSRIYAPGDSTISVELNGNTREKTRFHFRAYRVDNPVEFFLKQRDPHSPELASAPPNTFDMIRQGVDRATRDARYAARDVMPEKARITIRDLTDLNGTRKELRARAVKTSNRVTPPKETKDHALPDKASGYAVVAEWDHEVTPKSDATWFYESVPVPITSKGVYLIEASAVGKRAVTALVISELGMVIKQAEGEAVVFVVNRTTGQKVSSFPLTFARNRQVLSEQSTDGDGVASATIPPPPPNTETTDDDDMWEWRWRKRQLMVLGERDGNFVISEPWGGYDEQEPGRVYLHTDRPVYRPGQMVYYRGISRHITPDGTYETSGGDSVFIEISDARSNVFARDTLRLSDMGTFSGQVQLADEPPLGTYSVKVTIGKNESWFNFSVEEYKKPEYKVEVTTDKKNYTRGDVINATVKADYFFGSPVANAQVEYFVYRSRYWRPWWRGSAWEYLYEDNDDFATYRMEMISSGQGTLNPDGTFQISYQTDGAADQDYVYRVEANVVDNSRRSISGARSVEVTRGEFYISLRTDRYVYQPKDPVTIGVQIATFDGDRPVGTPFRAKAYRTWWVQEDTTGDSTKEWIERKELLWSGNGSTDGSGKGSITYTPEKAGYTRIEVAATDGRGTEITEESYVYVADEHYADWYREGSGDVQIIPDKESYRPGETMSALVIMPAAGIDALITAEGTKIYSRQVQRLNSTSAIVRMPVEERFAPTFFLNVSAIVNNQMYTESQRITVVPQGKLLQLQVKTDKDIYKPGARGTVMVRALDENNEPVPDVELAVGMVDEAVYSIQPDATPDIQRFFYGTRWNQVSTTASLDFNFYGQGLKMRGRAADALGSNGAAPPAPPMMAKAAAMADRRSLAFGDVKGEMFVQPTVRKNFKDLMFWTPSARTDADGWARLEVEFPDNLTTWRITARGVTRATAVGQAVARVIARKDLLVRMETPRFLTQGDELLIATTVHNYLSTGKVTKVQLAGQNVALDERERTLTIPANGEQRVDWKIKAPKTGTATLTVKALTNEESDAMELTVPVMPRGLRVATGNAAEIEEQTGSRTMSFTLPENSDPSTGSIHVTLSPSLASSIFNALDELIGYPYGCVEQTMSRFLPTVVVDNTLKQLNVPFDEKKRAEIPKMVNKGLTKLYGMQHDDGGWGWWSNDESDPFMTAYVMYGMTIARSAGYEVIQERYDNGLKALRAAIEAAPRPATPRERSVEATTQAYMLYVMSMIGKGTPQEYLRTRIATLAKVDTLNNYARALLAMAANYQNDRSTALALAGQLERGATVSSPYAFWKGRTWHYNWQDDQVETSAAVIKALLELRGETELTHQGIRWLVAQKVGDAWHNTRQTAMVIYSLSDYLKSSREMSPDYTVVVRVNGTQVYSKRMTGADVFKPEEQIALDRATIRNGANVVTVEKSGTGRLYTTSRLVYYATGNAIKPASAGFRVTREYYTLRKEKRGDVYVYAKQPFNGTVKTGDELFVKVKVTPDAGYEYFMLEDPLPAGCEVVTKTEGYTIAGESDYDEQEREKRGFWGWNWWYADRDVRDEKVSFFARTVLPQPYEFTYILRAQIPGTYAIMPSVASLMYYPEVRGNGNLLSMTITP